MFSTKRPKQPAADSKSKDGGGKVTSRGRKSTIRGRQQSERRWQGYRTGEGMGGRRSDAVAEGDLKSRATHQGRRGDPHAA